MIPTSPHFDVRHGRRHGDQDHGDQDEFRPGESSQASILTS
jgi:hypothetical protein